MIHVDGILESWTDLSYPFLPSFIIVLACDGLWDVFTSQEVISFVRRMLFVHSDLNLITNELIAYALERGSSDNTSATIVCFNQDM